MGTKKHFNILTFTDNGIETIFVTAKTSFIKLCNLKHTYNWKSYGQVANLFEKTKKNWKCKSKDLSIGLHLLIHSLLSARLKTFVNPKKKNRVEFLPY